MAVSNKELKVQKRLCRELKRKEISMEKKLTPKEIEKELGFDKIKPIVPSASDEKDMKEKGDSFNSWYEEELVKFYYDQE